MNLREIYRRFRAWQQNPFDYTNRSEHVERCANCGTEFNDNFCPRCGQKAGTGPIGWHTVRQGVMLIWGMDSRSLSYSLVQLLLRPGYMISDYLSGKRQVSFPPVKMLLIVAVGAMIAEWLFGEPSVESTPDVEEVNAAFDAFNKWAESNTGWAMLMVSCLLIFPTWLYFRYAPKHHKHSIPEGFFIQVFMGSLLAMTAILSAIIDSDWVMCLIPIYYYITYWQLFGFGWWGTLWRTCFCIYQGMILIIVVVWVANFIMGAPHRSPITIILGIGSTLFLTLIWYGVEMIKKKRNNNR